MYAAAIHIDHSFQEWEYFCIHNPSDILPQRPKAGSHLFFSTAMKIIILANLLIDISYYRVRMDLLDQEGNRENL